MCSPAQIFAIKPYLLGVINYKEPGQQMHEISLVRNILKTLEDEFPEELDKIRTIQLTVGILSNVQPILMQNAFEAVQQDEPRYKKANLRVIVLPILVHCDDCDKDSEVQYYKFACSYCGKPVKNIVQGEELLISKVEFAADEFITHNSKINDTKK